MHRYCLSYVVLVVATTLLLVLDSANAAKEKKSKSKKSKDPVALPATKLAKYIKCEGCKAFATNLFFQAEALLKEHKGRKKMGEEPVLELLESVCNQGEKEGEWLNNMDVVGTKGKLTVEAQKGSDGAAIFQACSGAECQALARVCDAVRTEAGESDIAEMIYRGHYMSGAAAFSERLCTKMTDSCAEKVELKDPRIDIPFEAVDSKKWEAQKMQKLMKGMGMGAQMYDRESMAEMMENEGLEGFGGKGGGAQDDAKEESEEWRASRMDGDLASRLPPGKRKRKRERERCSIMY